LAACATALVLALGACGQKGPLYMPSQAGSAAKPVSRLPSAPDAGRAVTLSPPPQGASSPALPAAAK
jgi:predicted small lipoprotein YifL